MPACTLIFPHQLFKKHAAIDKSRKVMLVEEHLYFNQYNFHKQKLVLHRASMKSYDHWLVGSGVEVAYIEAISELCDVRKLLPSLAQQGYDEIHYIDPHDGWLEKRIVSTGKKLSIGLRRYQTPQFLNTMKDAAVFFDKKQTYFQTAFYIDQRKKRKLLLDLAGEPLGGKWSFDEANRLKFPAKEKPPYIEFPEENDIVKEAIAYVKANFSMNYGNGQALFFPHDFATAERWLEDFLVHRFEKFGAYEDAIVSAEHFLHHAVLSPLLNTGLLLPQQVLDTAVAYAIEHNIPINSLEGFCRQIVGWREFIRIVYEREGTRQRTTNYWRYSRKIPAAFWSGTTGIEPLDQTIKKVLKTGYCHHIERLMIMGNFMVLCEFDPDEVYRWFMELFVDAYDWVMVPNVYGMTQFADGGLMTTKPYISSSNYIMKMSDYKKGPWTTIWDGLFWRFMDIHRDFFLKNPRLGMLVKTFDKMPADKKKQHHKAAEIFLAQLDLQKPDHETNKKS